MKRLLMPATTLTTLKKIAYTLLCCTVLMVFGAPAQTLQQIKADPGNNNPPPPGWILTLNGQPIPTTYQLYTVDFQATLDSTAITFAFRNDPSFTSFTNTSVTDVTTPSNTVVWTNGDFSGGTYTDPVSGNTLVPNGWTYANIYGATFGGVVQPDCGVGGRGTYCWFDGAVQAYDAISQMISTHIGDTYRISFYLTAGGGSTFSEVSTNGDTTDTGGNGINVTVYAQAGLPPPPPPGETLTLTELGQGSGNVSDNLEQINCSLTNGNQTGTCSANYPTGTVVTLTENTTAPSTFGGWGGACASFGTGPTCTLTMNSAQNVSASFNAPGPTQDGTVMTGTETIFNFQGGFANGGYNYNAELTSGSPVMAQVTVRPVVDQPTCNGIVNPSFPGAQCFVYQNGNGPGTPSPVMFELTCPGSPGGTCGTDVNPNFLAELGTDYNFDKTLNPGFNKFDPFPGWLKGVGPDPLHPCTQNPGNTPPLFQKNQIDFFHVEGDPTGVTKGGSGGTGSCWVATYNTPNEVPPGITINSPTATTYTVNQTVAANYFCSDPTSSKLPQVSNPTGPYLTNVPAGCLGPIASGINLDTSAAAFGPHTFTVNAIDTGMNTASKSVNYIVGYQSSGTCDGDAGHQVLQPINTPPQALSVFKGGSTIAVKFRVCDGNGVSIGTAGVVTSNPFACTITGSTGGPVDETVTSATPDTNFRWDSTNQQWIFNWGTKGLTAGGTKYSCTITLNDSSKILFTLALK